MGNSLQKPMFSGLLTLVLFFGMFLSPMLLWGQALPNEEDGLKFLYNRKRVKIPFQLVHNLIIIPIKINNSNPLNFVVDTGVDRTLLMEIGEFDTITLNNVEKLFLRGLGSGEGIQAMLSSGNSINFSGVESKNQKVLMLEENIFNLSSRLGLNVHGIIGYPLFRDFVVEIDYQNKVMTLFKPGTYPEKRAQKCTVVPLEIEASKPYVKVLANFPDGSKHAMRLIVDSGMSTSMLLYPPTLPDVKIPEKKIEAYLGRGLNGDIHGEIARLETLELGEYILKRPPACFPDTMSIRHALGLNNRNGNLGADILQRFKVVFDYPNSRMLLQPSHMYKKPFHYNLSGLELLSPIPGFNFYTIAQVIPNSPAQRAGLEPGDAIVSINGVKCIDKTLGEILEMFQNYPRRRLQLRISRQYKSFDTTIHLQDLI
ncbi:aspartyl protease family protein [Rufibacter hautae]|uniref:PDZ domain-containing protein n=1 Tax=Rufibacter hautae TaxID=2595005 RepID=A0A5B6TFJ8_9BACT|nr:aspartyl protease family protein [Rufibacter hautae]KAA3439161.1 PDZ domain-containing protein [Rufibacter hautae]